MNVCVISIYYCLSFGFAMGVRLVFADKADCGCWVREWEGSFFIVFRLRADPGTPTLHAHRTVLGETLRDEDSIELTLASSAAILLFSSPVAVLQSGSGLAGPRCSRSLL